MRRTIFLLLALALFSGEAFARGGSFGGSRGGGSFGGSRGGGSFGGRSAPAWGSRGSSGGSRWERPAAPSAAAARSGGSFGGTRMSSPGDYTRSYGIPRYTERAAPIAGSGATNLHYYGGGGDAFMRGYAYGMTPWYWHMPFYPAFYYSRPYVAYGPDGTAEVYPPTFSWGTLFFMLLIVGGIGWIVYRIWRARRGRPALLGRTSFD